MKIGVAFYAANAARAAASYMNESIGGIGGRPVEIVTCDTWNDPVEEAECGATFVADAEMDFVIEPRSSQALLDALRPDQIPFGMWYWSMPPARSGPSYAPSFASMMVAATKFFRGKVADAPNPRILVITPFPMYTDDITKLYHEAQVAVVSPQPSLNAELERLGITEADAVFVDSWDDCGALDPALEQFGPNLVRYTWTCMDRPEGWFLGHVIDDPKNPAVTLGSATATRQLDFDGPQPDGLYGYLPFAQTDPELLFGDILTIAKLYNMAGGDASDARGHQTEHAGVHRRCDLLRGTGLLPDDNQSRPGVGLQPSAELRQVRQHPPGPKRRIYPRRTIRRQHLVGAYPGG